VTYLKSLAEDAALLNVFQAHPETARPLMDFHEVIMRRPSPFTAGERELIAAYVSGVNACGYCHGVHTKTAEAFGVAPGVLEAALADLDTAPIDDRMRPVLRYVGKLTSAPSRMTPGDAETVYAAGWDEQALYDAVLVCALFNFMNRMVDGLGVSADEAYFEKSGYRLKELGYAGLATLLDQ
jgi:uncharacterized peroxidase-related enzyme